MVALKDVLKAEKMLTGSKMVVSLGLLTNLDSLKAGRMVGLKWMAELKAGSLGE